MEGVHACVSGLSVMRGNADTDLADYPNDAFISWCCPRPFKP